jgi:coproporphyrinogen III oxidase
MPSFFPLQVFEKAGVNVSVVYGMLPPDAYRTATGSNVSRRPAPLLRFHS